MLSYYTTMILLSWMALGVLCVLVHENSWIPRPDKRHFYLAYGVIALSALAEWSGIQLSGNERFPAWLLSLVKCADYTLTPMAGGAIVAQMKLRNRWSKALMSVLAFNMVFQLLACFNGWMTVIDEHHYYSHGPLYPVYMVIYLLVIVLAAAQFREYGKAYRRQNRFSLYSVLLLVVAGIVIQELMGREYKTAYTALTMGVTLMFIHYSEFYQMSADDHMKQQHSQLMLDALSGVYSRHAYMKELDRYRRMTRLPDTLAVFTVDINGLKSVNDTLGHDAGDELIVGAAQCIEKVVGSTGRCYRTGGDEFVVLAKMSREQARAALLRLTSETRQWTGDKAERLSISTGCALARDHQGSAVEKLIREADRAMYAAKAEYYRKSGHDRRDPR